MNKVNNLLVRIFMLSLVTIFFISSTAVAATDESSLETAFWNLKPAERELVVMHPVAALIVDQCKEDAMLKTAHYYGWKGYTDGSQSNAFLHSIWNAQMTSQLNDRTLAEQFATAHEDATAEQLNGVWFGYNGYSHKTMDLYNNAKGRETVGTWELYPSIDVLSSRVIAKIRNNEMRMLVFYPGSSLQYGSNNVYVKMIQDKLHDLGYYSPEIADGIFGTNTKNAVINYQRDNSLTPDGIVGPLTWSKMIPTL